MSSDPAHKKITAYYDGKCPMCSAIADRVRNSDRCDVFDLRDMHEERSMPFKKAAIEREMHVVDREGNVHRGAGAIFKITEQYPRFQLPTRIARAQPIGALAQVIYRLIAANRRFIAGQASRIFWLKVTIITAFCIGLLLSSRLWIGPRTYPTVPLSGFLPAINSYVAHGLFAALFALAAIILVSPRPQKFVIGFVAIIALFCVFDQTRWQPWVFQYGFLLTTLALFSWRSGDADGQKRILNIARLVIAGTYFFSGLQKLNWNFIDYDFPWIVQPITKAFPFSTSALHIFGACAPFVQIAFSVGLLIQKFRNVALTLAIAMHVFILAMFGPFGHDWNNVVWPWTTAMAVFDILLFAGAKFSLREVMWPQGHNLHRVALLLFTMLPLLSFINLWDSYLSAALYSGNLNEAIIYVSDAGERSLPKSINSYLVHTSANTNVLNLQRWAIEDLNVTPYPETRLFRSIGREICKYLTEPNQLVLVVREQRMFFSQPETSYRCSDM